MRQLIWPILILCGYIASNIISFARGRRYWYDKGFRAGYNVATNVQQPRPQHGAPWGTCDRLHSISHYKNVPHKCENFKPEPWGPMA